MTVFSIIFTLQKFTNFHAIRSWNFHNICNKIFWPRFCATLYVFIHYTYLSSSLSRLILVCHFCRIKVVLKRAIDACLVENIQRLGIQIAENVPYTKKHAARSTSLRCFTAIGPNLFCFV